MNSQTSEPSSSSSASRGSTGEESSYSFDPANNEVEELYGPPYMFDPSDNSVEVLYGPPEVFEPSLNKLQLLYGPPPFMLDGDDDSADEKDWEEEASAGEGRSGEQEGA